jgi:hypothetical protein
MTVAFFSSGLMSMLGHVTHILTWPTQHCGRSHSGSTKTNQPQLTAAAFSPILPLEWLSATKDRHRAWGKTHQGFTVLEADVILRCGLELGRNDYLLGGNQMSIRILHGPSQIDSVTSNNSSRASYIVFATRSTVDLVKSSVQFLPFIDPILYTWRHPTSQEYRRNDLEGGDYRRLHPDQLSSLW